MKTLTLFALHVLAVVVAKNYFIDTPGLMSAENAYQNGVVIRSLSELREYLGLSEDFSFQVEASRLASTGLRRVRLRQHFKGLPIRVATLQASQNENGFYTGAVSGFCPVMGDGFDTSVSNSKEDIQRAMIEYMNANDEIPNSPLEVSELQNFHLEKQIHIDHQTGSPVVVYYASGLVDRGLNLGAYIRYPRILFKAGYLEVLSAILPVQKEKKRCNNAGKTCPSAKGGNAKSCGPIYGSKRKQVCLNALFLRDNKCVLANERVNVKSVANQWKRDNAKLVVFDCDEPLEDGGNGAFSSAADAFYYAQVFYDVLDLWGGIERTNREPHTLHIQFGDVYSNSFWDGRSTTFGDGGELTYPFVVGEIVGHEMCHALTDSFGNLVFDNEAESMNEAFSDICGKAITFFLEGRKADWKFADGLMKNPNKALRYFNDPTLDGEAIANFELYTPQTGKYVAMGIIMKAFFTIVNDEHVPFRDAYEAFVYANQIYWNEESGFVDGACGVVRAASDLGLEVISFLRGFEAVNIDLHRCSLKGTEDHISRIDFNKDGEYRKIKISSSRRASFFIQPDSDKHNIRVTIACRKGQHVTIGAHWKYDGSFETMDSSPVFPIYYGTQIVISTDSSDILELDVLFEFE